MPSPWNPFRDVPRTLLTMSRKQSRCSLSRIHDMTVGDVRQCFSQMRHTIDLNAKTILWCGITAGHFALQYIVYTTGGSRKRRSGPRTAAKTQTPSVPLS